MVKEKVLLIYPPNQLMPVEAPRPDGSLGPLYLASYLESRGIETDVLDASVGTIDHNLQNTFHRRVMQGNGLIRIGMSFDEIADYVSQGQYTSIGISSNFTPQTKILYNVASAIKKISPETHVYTGGVNSRALYNTILRTGLFDGVCMSEGEVIFHNMLTAMRERKSLEGVVGAAYLDNSGNVKVNEITAQNAHLCYPSNLDELTMPAWHKLPFIHYDNLDTVHGIDVTARQGQRYAPIMTSRGCPFKCAYCHISHEKNHELDIGNLRLFSEERVIAEMERLKGLGVRKLFFEDDSLLAKQDRILRILANVRDKGMTAIDSNGVNLMHFYNRTDPRNWTINENFVESVANSGLQEIVFPVESANPRVVTKYATGKVDHRRMNVVDLMRTMVKYNLRCPVNMMVGFPDETAEEMHNSFEMGRRLIDAGAPYVTYFIPIPFPGSKLYDIAVAGGHLNPYDTDPSAAYDIDRVSWTDRLNWKNAVMVNTSVPPAEVVRLRDKFFQETNREEFKAKGPARTVGHRYAKDIEKRLEQSGNSI